MELPRTEPGQLIVTPHPLLLDGQRNVVWEARAEESLYALLMRNVPELDGQPWAVAIGGVPVERHLWHSVFPKQGQVIEVRGGVGKTALAVVAMIALTYFTMGAGAGWIAGSFGVAAGGAAAAVIGAGLFIAGSMLINKVLAPKPAKAGGQSQDSVYSLSGARNQLRQYEPLPMLFGRVRITPDLLSKPYTWYEGNDQYLGMQLCAGINVGRIEAIYNGDTLLSSYEGARVYHAGYSQMPAEQIPLYSNADVTEGGQLLDTNSDPKHTPSAWIERTSSADTVRLIVGLEYQLYDKSSKGKDKNNTERVEVQYRPTGTTGWLPFGSYTITSSKTKAYRAGYGKDVARGQYDVRVRTAGLNTNGSGAQAAFTWSTLTSVQVDEGDYTGLSRSGVQLKATGQLNGTPDELRAIGYADPIPVWDGTAYHTVETSNPGAQILAYARGIVREGRLLGGMALDEAQIDVESLKAFTLHCASNGYAYNFYIKDPRNHEQVLSAIALAGFGQVTWAGGRLGVVWAAQDQPLSGVVNMGTIKKGQFQIDYSLSNAADGIEYTYVDGDTWETKTLRVPAPGVTTMLNPAQVSGEGVTSEAHAAELARWHLAQSLYQYKDISYSTDIEHLSYQRLSLLALQHDMTQWGFGGRVVGAVNDAGTVTLALDEPVPAPTSGVAYIGLRIPGERVYRVLRVKPFAGESSTIELLDGWPSDAALPGGVADNPAHDTLWIYDFKQTPGLRVRVVGIEPESDLKGASVRVVAEGPEFWVYVKTGNYVPSPNESQLPTRPVASNLRITEQQIAQGNTQFTELTATFDITGPVGHVLVLAAGPNQELQEVTQTQTRTATWRIPQADVYSIVVRPFAPDGTAGVAVSATYATAGADIPPVLVDLFDVQELSGGVRLYTWGWLAETMRSADFAGVEIRYIADHVIAPDWDAMTPIGDTGYHSAAFEAVMPASGKWTFACRSCNTSGELSVGMRIIQRTLGKNLGQSLADITLEQVAQQEAIDAALAASLAAELKAAKSLVLMGEEYDAASTYVSGDVVYFNGRMYRAKADVEMDTPPPDTDYWEDVGTVTEAQSSTSRAVSQLRTDVDEQGNEFAAAIDQVESGMASVTNAIKAVGGGGNLIANADMSVDLSGWNISWNDGGWLGPARNAAGGNYYPPGVNTISAYRPGVTDRTMYLDIVNTTPIPVAAGKRYCFSAYMNPSRCSQQIFLAWLDASGNVISYSPASDFVNRHGVSLPGSNLGVNWVRGKIVVLAPTNATRAQLVLRTMAVSGQDTPYPFWCRPMFEEVAPSQEEPSPWSIGGQEQAASQTVTLDVNGYISGTQSMNDGKRSSFSILANIFRVISSASSGLEWQNGYLRAYSAGIQLVLGINFGAASNLCFWYGPNVGVGNCNKSNGTIWFDNTGGAYFGGSLSAGVKKNAVQTTTTVTVGTELVNGPFDTNGTVRQVTISFGRSTNYVSNAFGAGGFVAGAGANSASVAVYRKIGNAAETLWQTMPVGGGINIFNEGDAPDRATAYWSGSMTINDTSPAASTVTYRAVITAFASQDISHPGTINSITTTQNLSIISVEN
ncbi:host specificity factor TipJ family phage tail protein [Stenotrophomonas sp.]|uniref:host specificity factor TipJ family phage tail protein n=1 Tax=Stenotrophomonas sp. TaxID=69392 RepID=UPI0028AAF29D|nr:host specificity factor TipJ family phage tail protein [Stenotrophomonas sp.]